MLLACHTHPWEHQWEKALEEIAEIGFAGIEHFPDFYKKYAHQTEQAKRELEHDSLRLSAHYHACDYCIEEKREEIFHETLPLVQFLYAIGSHILVLDNPRRSIIEDIRKDFSVAAETLTELGKRCQDYDVRLCIHTHYNHRIMKDEEIDRLMNLVDLHEVFLAPDTGQLQRAEEDPASIIQTYKECLQHIILSDLSPDHDQGDLPHPPLGQGCVQFNSIYKTLTNIEYEGWNSLFFESSTDKAKEHAQQSINHWKQILEEEG